MHILFTDETNLTASESVRFLVYGGICFPIDALPEMDARIEEIRSAAGFLPGDDFKFRYAAAPEDHVTFSEHRKAKRRVLSLCEELGCKFIVHVVHHGVIKNQDTQQQIQWGANCVIGRFNLLLREIDDDGICVVDNLPGPGKSGYSYLAEKFTRGLTLYNGREIPLPRIKLYASTCNNASHASSAMDIVVGSFRYCINENGSKSIRATLSMLPPIVRLLWHRRLDDGGCKTIGRGLVIRPTLERVRSDFKAFAQDYEDLVDGVNELLQRAR
jgi:hypothetical protein